MTDRKLIGTGAFYTADVLTLTDYYAFGQAIAERTYNAGAYRYGMNGQEKDTDIDLHHTTALYWEYDSRIGRRWNLDPVVKEWESPYMCFGDNPITGSDVLGNDTKSPIYVDGKFVGTDKNGFKGDPIIMNKYTYALMPASFREKIKKGTFSDESAMAMGETLNQKISNMDNIARKNNKPDKNNMIYVNKEVTEINSIINDIVSKTSDMKGFEPSKLHNGRVSSIYDTSETSTHGRSRVFGNDNEGTNGTAMAITSGNKVTYLLRHHSAYGLTVENIQNTYIHEAGGHFYKGWSNDDHLKVTELQMKHPTFKHTTPDYQQRIHEIHAQYEPKK